MLYSRPGIRVAIVSPDVLATRLLGREGTYDAEFGSGGVAGIDGRFGADSGADGLAGLPPPRDWAEREGVGGTQRVVLM